MVKPLAPRPGRREADGVAQHLAHGATRDRVAQENRQILRGSWRGPAPFSSLHLSTPPCHEPNSFKKAQYFDFFL